MKQQLGLGVAGDGMDVQAADPRRRGRRRRVRRRGPRLARLLPRVERLGADLASRPHRWRRPPRRPGPAAPGHHPGPGRGRHADAQPAGRPHRPVARADRVRRAAGRRAGRPGPGSRIMSTLTSARDRHPARHPAAGQPAAAGDRGAAAVQRVQVGLGARRRRGRSASSVPACLAANGQVARRPGPARRRAGAEQTALQAEAAKYAEVPAVYAAGRGGRGAAHPGHGQGDPLVVLPQRPEPDHARQGLADPDDGDRRPSTPPPRRAAPAPARRRYGTPGIGTVTFKGNGYTHNDVAAWLESLAKQQGLDRPLLHQVERRARSATEDSVTFDSQAVITEDALSGRYTDKAGS